MSLPISGGFGAQVPEAKPRRCFRGYAAAPRLRTASETKRLRPINGCTARNHAMFQGPKNRSLESYRKSWKLESEIFRTPNSVYYFMKRTTTHHFDWKPSPSLQGPSAACGSKPRRRVGCRKFVRGWDLPSDPVFTAKNYEQWPCVDELPTIKNGDFPSLC